MNSKYILSFFLLGAISLSAWAGKDFGCIDGKIRYIDGKEEKVVKESYCYDTILRKIYSSGRCKPNTKCMADFDKPIMMKVSEVSGETGSPGFKICEKVGGVPQIMEFWEGNQWVKTARCIFKDGSYIDNGTLATKVNYSDAPVSKEAPKETKKK